MLACVTCTFRSFKSQVCAAARALLHLSAHFGTVFSISDKKDVHLMGQYYPHCPNKVMELSLYTFFVLSVSECETVTQSCGQNHGYLSLNGIFPCFM